jgi:HD superfamily phosphodiesterase
MNCFLFFLLGELKLWNNLVLKKFVEKQLSGIPLIGLSQINRVSSFCEEIKLGLDFNEQVLFASLMLHNVGVKFFIGSNADVSVSSVSLSKRFLFDNFFPANLIQGVLHSIQECKVGGVPSTIEAKILHDSFLLDEIGAIGVLKDSFVFVSKKKSFSNWVSSSQSKLSIIRNNFFLDKARELSVSRAEFFENYFKALELEL